MRRGLVALTALGLALAVALSGCSASRPPAASAGDKLSVVAAEDMWGSIASELGGTKAEVRSIVANPNADPHEYEATVADAKAVASANLTIANGAGYDTWMTDLVAASSARARVNLNVSTIAGVKAGGNPHLWYSPSAVRIFADKVTAAYKRLDPADAAYFDQQHARFVTQTLKPYDELVSAIASTYASEPIGTSESLVLPLAEACKLRVITPLGLTSAISEGIDPSAADKATADAQIRGKQIRVFVYNRQNSTPDVAALADEAKAAGIPVVTMTETIEPPGTSFVAWQVAQLEALRSALATSTGR